MKKAFNLTTCKGDADFLADPAETARQLEGYDGIELQVIDDPPEGLIDPSLVTGLHMTCVPCWYALWRGDEQALLDEFGTLAEAEAYYGGPLTRDTLLNKFRRDLAWAERLGAEYLVFHAAESRVIESFTEEYLRTDEEICEACAEMLGILFEGRKDGPLLLLENLWQPGMNLRRPEITRDMLAAVTYPNKGVMLDTGHLMNTNTSVNTQEQGLSRIRQALDAHEAAGFDLCGAVRGVHLNASTSGSLAERMKKDPPKLEGSYKERTSKMFFHVFERDQHKPFTVPGVKDLIECLCPDYLTTELITMGQDDRREKNSIQLNVLG
ncbi:MAG: sugar phosphate isomerase/epimerase [Clostridia bacterium]|nr:sugar phosphate isomerase/epimerase [Clostridia bacterium]